MRILYISPWPCDTNTYNKDNNPKTDFGFHTIYRHRGGVECLSPNRKSKLRNWFWKKFPFLAAIETQFIVIGNARNYDVVYSGFDMHLLPLAVIKALGLCKTPVFALSHFTYNRHYTDKAWKKIYIRVERYLVFKYIDRLSFANERLLKIAADGGKLNPKHNFFCNWGATLDFYNRNLYRNPPTSDFFMSAGGMNRDYRTLVKAFELLPETKLKVFAKYKDYTKGEVLPANIDFPNLSASSSYTDSYKILRDNYYNCIAVLLPVSYQNDVPNGATVLVEALAMGKPIVITEADTNYIDVELEGCGLKVKPHNVQSWVDAIKFLIGNPDKVSEMGRRSYELAKTKYNDSEFANTIYAQMKDLVENKI